MIHLKLTSSTSPVFYFFILFPCTPGDDPSEALPKHDDDADDFNPGDDWTSLCHNKEMDVDDVSDSSEDEFIGSMTCRQTKKRGVLCGHVTLQSTLAFCYLGLLWIDEPVFISDLVR